MNARALSLVAALAALPGCVPDLTPAQEVVRPRIMGARIEVNGQPEVAGPEFGDEVTVRFRIGFAGTPTGKGDHLDVAGRFCVALRASEGSVLCLQEVPIDARAEGVGPEEVQLRFTLPSLQDAIDALGEAPTGVPEGSEDGRAVEPSLVLFGAVCARGRVRVDQEADLNEVPLPDVFGCRPNEGVEEPPEPLSFTLTIASRERAGNLNPSFGCETETTPNACRGEERDNERKVDGDIVLVRPLPEGADEDTAPDIEVWPAPPETVATKPFTDCRDREGFEDLPTVRVGEDEYEIRLRFDPEDREALPNNIIGPKREELFVYAAHTEDGGSLDGYLSLLDADTPDDELEAVFEYKPPENNADVELPFPAGGRLVRFYFMVRDGRGGTDFAERAVCLLRDGG